MQSSLGGFGPGLAVYLHNPKKVQSLQKAPLHVERTYNNIFHYQLSKIVCLQKTVVVTGNGHKLNYCQSSPCAKLTVSNEWVEHCTLYSVQVNR